MANVTERNKVVLGNGDVLIDLTKDTVTKARVLKGDTFHSRTGAIETGTCTYDADTTSGNLTPDMVVEGGIGWSDGKEVRGRIPRNKQSIIEVSDVNGDVTVPYGLQDGSTKVVIAPTEKEKLIASNIRQGITVLGVAGSMSGSEGVKAQTKTVTSGLTEQRVSPDEGYTHLAEVVVQAIPIVETENPAGGLTVTIG